MFLRHSLTPMAPSSETPSQEINMDRRDFLAGAVGAMTLAHSLRSAARQTASIHAPDRLSVRTFGVGGAGINILKEISSAPSALTGDVSYLDIVSATSTSVAESAATTTLEAIVVAQGNLRYRSIYRGTHPRLPLAIDTDVVIVVAGLGGSAGSRLAPLVAQKARQAGAYVIAIGVMPFTFEGARRNQIAASAQHRLLNTANFSRFVDNDEAFDLQDPTMDVAFSAIAQHVGMLLDEGLTQTAISSA